MIFAVLIVILLVILFGAAAVKGWIKGVFGGILAFIALSMLAMSVIKLVGESGLTWVLMASAVIFVAGMIFKSAAVKGCPAAEKEDRIEGKVRERYRGKWDREGDFDGRY